MIRWAWCWKDRGVRKSVLERKRGSLWVAVGCIDSCSWIPFQTLVHVCVCVSLCVCEREWEREGRSWERKWESKKERQRAPWKQLQQHKMEFVSALPELCTFSIHLSDTVDFPPHLFFFFLHLEWMWPDYKQFEYKMKFPCCWISLEYCFRFYRTCWQLLA